MNSKPLISVIIPSYNCAQYVPQAVQSALDQTYAPVDIIVIDDGSTDGTEAALSAFGDRIRYVRQTNGGVSKARNRGLAEAKGDYIAFLDADDQWLPEKLQKQYECMQSDPDICFVHTDLYRVYDDSPERIFNYRDRERFVGRCYAEFFWGNKVMTSTVLVSRSVVEKVGGFDNSIRHPSTEDMDLWMKIAKHGSLGYVAEPLLLYREHPNNGSKNQRKMLENEYYVLSKALAADPTLEASLGKEKIRARIAYLAYEAGYSNLEADDLAQARRYFRLSLGHQPRAPRVFGLWASTFLPNAPRKFLRSMKQRAAGTAEGSQPSAS